MNTPRISFIGTGNMSSAIVQGLLRAGYPSAQLRGTTARAETAAIATQNLGIQVDNDHTAAVAAADILILGVKPQKMMPLCNHLGAVVQKHRPLVISLAAGLLVDTLKQWLGDHNLAVLRCMPNTPVKLGAGVSGFYAPANITAAQQQQVDAIFSLLGTTQWVQHESELHTMTAIAGSAPAYFYYFTEALAAAAEQLGASSATAQTVAVQVALGAARMMHEGDESPAQLRARVSSPGGTTVAALAQMAHLDDLLKQAVQASHARSIELSNGFPEAHNKS